jgi:hypothetical protein
MVTVPIRVPAAGLAANVAVADPAAVPPDGETLIQLESLTDDDQDPPLHPGGPALLIVNWAEPPPAGIAGTEEGAALNAHAGIAPFCETEILVPAIVNVPDRGFIWVFCW